MVITKLLTADDFLSNKRTGRQETPKQRYWRLLWANSPPRIRENLSAFHRQLQRDEDTLEYKLVSYDCLKRYKQDYDWESWYSREILDNLDKNLREKIVDYESRALSKAVEKYEELTRVADLSEQQYIRSKQNVNLEDTRSIDTATKLSYMYLNEIGAVTREINEFNKAYMSLQEIADRNKVRESPFTEIIKLSLEYNKQKEQQTEEEQEDEQAIEVDKE